MNTLPTIKNRGIAPITNPAFTHNQKIFEYRYPFELESGAILPQFHLAYETFGTLNNKRDNVIWIFHALTGNTNPLEWWNGLAGETKLIDPHKHFIICVNMPGSHYGSINALSKNPLTSKPYYHTFPTITTRDMAKMYDILKLHLGISQVKLGIGGSMGGMQLLEWSIVNPTLFKNIAIIASNAMHSPWGIAFNEAQRMAIESDITWKENNNKAGTNGLMAARALALLSYRNYQPFLKTQSDSDTNKIDGFKASGYQRYQGEKLTKRFNAFSYYSLTKSMDSHNVGRNRGSASIALQMIRANTLVIGINTDLLFPIQEQQFLAEHIPNAIFESIDSEYGHDGFLIEFSKLDSILRKQFRI
jgi:homoserine O-acetyltransferase